MSTILAYAFAAVAALTYLGVLDFKENNLVVSLFSMAIALILLVRADLKDLEKRVR